ncbi:hypothetical protein [Streptacidiphilus alkalitolerans]|uniref:hypothetical protein n=1 Tax=Streptacidiphilus alkalitolerans TaxID=3342712 RepID=UPI0039F182F2
MLMLALSSEARRWEPKRLRLRLFSAAGQLITTGRRRWLHLGKPWTLDITTAFNRLQVLPNPTDQQQHLTPTSRTRSSGIRRPPDATVGPKARPSPARSTETACRENRPTVTKHRG